MILEGNFPPDIRVEKEARSLIKARHKVYLLCNNEENRPSEEIKDDIFIKRGLVSDKNFFLRKINSLIFYTTFYHKKNADQINQFIVDNKIDAIHVHDLPLVKTAIKIAQKFQLPVIADLHENYPAALSVWGASFWDKLYKKNPKRWKALEKWCLKRANKVIVVIDEAKDRIIRNYNIDPNKITVVSNTEDVEYFNSIPLDKQLIEKYKNNFIVSYVGGFGPHRGLDTAIQAMNLVSEKISNVRLLLVGGKANEKELRNLTDKLNLQNRVIFTGWQPAEILPTYIYLSNICLVPHHKNPHTDSTIPHKLFQYMLMKKPVVVSNCKPLERIINETRAGLVFKDGNPQDLAEKIIQIYKNPDQYGENGYRAILEKYNWENEGKKLIALYRNLL